MSNGSLDPTALAPRIGVVAKQGKTLDGGLSELRSLLAAAGHPDPLWAEVSKGKRVPAAAADLIDQGAERLLVWGGDGTVQRAFTALVGTKVELGVLPAGTGNVFATNLGIPVDLEGAFQVAMGGWTARVDLGRAEGEPFGVMAGVGFDALLVREADKGSKGRFGRASYVFHGVKNAGTVEPVAARVKVDGRVWFEGSVTAVLVANAGTLMGGIRAFPDARMDDGLLEVGVVTAKRRLEWLRLGARLATGAAASSPFVEVGQGKKISVKLDRPVRYEVDGGDRAKVKRFRVRAVPGAVQVCVPAPEGAAAVAGSSQAAAVAETVSGS
jgi:diacylglycerol kinase (ATP)